MDGTCLNDISTSQLQHATPQENRVKELGTKRDGCTSSQLKHTTSLSNYIAPAKLLQFNYATIGFVGKVTPLTLTEDLQEANAKLPTPPPITGGKDLHGRGCPPVELVERSGSINVEGDHNGDSVQSLMSRVGRIVHKKKSNYSNNDVERF